MSTSATLRGVANDALRIWIAILAIIAAVAGTSALPGVAARLRDALGFGFAGVPSTWPHVVDIAAHNAAIAAVPLSAAVAVEHGAARRTSAISAVLVGLLIANSVAVGLALGAYGSRAAVSLAPHAPLEFAAFAVAGAAYMQTRRHAVGLRSLAGVAAVVLLPLVVAAFLEVFVSPDGASP